jgi:hypothetical protein
MNKLNKIKKIIDFIWGIYEKTKFILEQTIIQYDWSLHKNRLGWRYTYKEDNLKALWEDRCVHTKDRGLRKNHPVDILI